MTDTQYAGMDGTPYPPAAAATTDPVDTFNGNNALLVNCIRSLLNLDAAGALVPHGIGDHARGLLSAAAVRLASTPVFSHMEARGTPAIGMTAMAVDTHGQDMPGYKPNLAPTRMIPPGFALVPLRFTREMQRAVETEGWSWRDVLEAAGTVTEAQCEQASEEPEGLPIEQEPKYTTDGTHLVNRASGERIPHDEPVFVLRARDAVAVHAMRDYLARIRGREPFCSHYAAVTARVSAFAAFAEAHPERMKWPDTAPTFSDAGLSRLAAAVKGGA